MSADCDSALQAILYTKKACQSAHNQSVPAHLLPLPWEGLEFTKWCVASQQMSSQLYAFIRRCETRGHQHRPVQPAKLTDRPNPVPRSLKSG